MIIDCLSKAIFMYIIYLVVSLMLFGVPRSLSMTYYLFKERVDNLKYLFPSMITMMVVFMMPCWLQISEGSPYQFMTFLSMAALMFVGATPAFNDSDMENHIHTVAAYVCAIFASLWIILVTPYWYVLLIMLVIIGAIAYVTKTWKTAYIFWLENVVLISAFITMLTYYETFIKI